MNLGFYIDSQAQSETTNKVYTTLNSFVENNMVDNATLFYNDIDFNPVEPKFGCFSCTDIWFFTGTLVITDIKNALSISKVINKFKPFFLYNHEKNSTLELISIAKNIPIVTESEQDANYIKRITGFEAKVIPDGNLDNIMEIVK